MEKRIDVLEDFLERYAIKFMLHLYEVHAQGEKLSKDYFNYINAGDEPQYVKRNDETAKKLDQIMKDYWSNFPSYISNNKHYTWWTIEESYKKMVERDIKAKRETFIKRINNICGNIVDVNYLNVSLNGELNGYVKGDKGKAKVETILAGGYNIQCLHARVLVKEFK